MKRLIGCGHRRYAIEDDSRGMINAEQADAAASVPKPPVLYSLAPRYDGWWRTQLLIGAAGMLVLMF